MDSHHPERFYLPPPGFYGSTHTFHVKVPEELSCKECTLQWRWWSANSCIPATGYGCFAEVLNSRGYDAAAWGVRGDCPGNCGGNVHCGCGEQFRNCADITILPAGGTTMVPSTSAVHSTATTTKLSSSSTTTSTTSVPSSTATTSFVPTTTTMMRCISAGAEVFGGSDDKCARACESLPVDSWPCGAGHICDCSKGGSTTATTTQESTTSAVGRTCLPAPGLPPNGATASNCAQCAAGYKWWPCNTNPAICACTGGALAQLGQIRKLHGAFAISPEQ